MSHLQLDGDTLKRLLAQAGVTAVEVGSAGATLAAAGWEARVERLQVEGTVRVGALALRVSGVEFGGDGVEVRFSVA